MITSSASEMTTRIIDLICADEHLDNAFKRGLRMANEIRREQEVVHLQLLALFGPHTPAG